MSKITEPGFLFIQSGILNHEQIKMALDSSVTYLSNTYNMDFSNYESVINVVTNREGKKFGHTYAWVKDERIYNALIGNNFDGSSRYEDVLDEDWKEPEKDYDEAVEEAGESWADIEEVEDMYRRPTIRKKLEPLVTPPAIKYTESQKIEINNESELGFIDIFETKITERFNKQNTIFSSNIPDWVDEKILLDVFKKFNKDDIVYSEKKSKKKFTYPIVKIKKKKGIREENKMCTVTFSHLHKNTASFLINVVKRIKVEKGDKKTMLFFSQSKSKNN